MLGFELGTRFHCFCHSSAGRSKGFGPRDATERWLCMWVGSGWAGGVRSLLFFRLGWGETEKPLLREWVRGWQKLPTDPAGFGVRAARWLWGARPGLAPRPRRGLGPGLRFPVSSLGRQVTRSLSFADEHRLYSGKLCLIILTCIAEVGAWRPRPAQVL